MEGRPTGPGNAWPRTCREEHDFTRHASCWPGLQVQVVRVFLILASIDSIVPDPPRTPERHALTN
eukprot:4914041-Amphidinium_carterae.1